MNINFAYRRYQKTFGNLNKIFDITDGIRIIKARKLIRMTLHAKPGNHKYYYRQENMYLATK